VRAADLAIVAFVALLTIALVVNTTADLRYQRRYRIDAKVLHNYIRAHPELGRGYNSNSFQITSTTDAACAYRGPEQQGHTTTPKVGVCLYIASRPDDSRRVIEGFGCKVAPLPGHPRRETSKLVIPVDTRYCPWGRY
jgi:hypothetical protein